MPPLRFELETFRLPGKGGYSTRPPGFTGNLVGDLTLHPSQAIYSHLTDIVGGGLVGLGQLRIRLPGGCEAVGASALQERNVQAERQPRTGFPTSVADP